MGYEELIREVVAAHVDEIETDLDRARRDLRRARTDVSALEQRVASLETLMERAALSSPKPVTGPSMTLHAAMAEVLVSAPEYMMRAGDLASEIERRRLYRMRDGRPVEAQQIHARVGNYPDLFEKVGTLIRLHRSDQ